MSTVIGSIVAVVLCVGLHAASPPGRLQTNAPGPRIVVPAVKAVPVVVDGKFSPGEWEGAFRQPLGEDFEVYLLADADYLCVGFKYLKDVQADFLSEVYVATSDKQFVNLHSSGSLGEGVNDLPLPGGRTTFTIVAPMGASRAAWWESNAMPRSVAGVQGKEFKISRARLPGGTVRFAGGMGVVNMTMRANAVFPKGHGFSSTEKWAELVLPPAKWTRAAGRTEQSTKPAVQTSAAIQGGDGNSYRAVTIGGQVWMAENLRSTRTCEGTPIEHDVNPRSGDAVATYGRLYTQAAVLNGEASSTANPSGVRGVCPCGWHLPSDAEWQQLVDALGGAAVAGGKLKARGTAAWASPNAGATDETGFSALPAGWHDFTGAYEGLGTRAFFRTASGMRARFLDHDTAAVGSGNIHPRDAASVRCVMDR